jgi:peptidoglycan/LPS O-acetylase OafA/YrhL
MMPWSFISSQLEGLGAKNLSSDPMLNYWLRMTAGAFTFIGILCFVAAINPIKQLQLIRSISLFLLCEGIVLLIAGITLHLFPVPYVVDSMFCLLIGGSMLVLSGMIKTESKEVNENHEKDKGLYGN